MNTYVFFEVPNALQTFHKLFIWDIIYEHCSYFTPISLALAFSSSGFHIYKLTEEYEGQYLCVHARPSDQSELDSDYKESHGVNLIANDIALFATNYQNKVEKCKHELEKIESRGHRVVLWGASSKGVTFLNMFKNYHQIEFVIDINPHKQGGYIPGTGQRIVGPEFLRDYKPDIIITMNPIYKLEIRQLMKKFGLSTKFMDV